MEISELIPGKWYNPTKQNTNYYFKFIRDAKQSYPEIKADYFQKNIPIYHKDSVINNTDFWKNCREVEYSEIEQFIPEEFKEKHCEYLIHN